MESEIKNIPPKKIRLLILEDRALDAELELQWLTRAGFELDWERVQSESDFVARLNPSLDLILADYRLPQFNGLQALRLLRQSGLDIPCIIVSGTVGDEIAAECIKEGASDYLLKDRLVRLGAAVSRAFEDKRLRAERKRAELRIAALSNLGQKLNSAKTAKEAAEIIVVVADQLLGWDCCTVDLYSLEKNQIHSVLNQDTVNGQHVNFPPAYDAKEPSPLTRRAIENGALLILKEEPYVMSPDGVAFGDASRPSASLMFAPIRDSSKVIGVLSIQSYTPKAYNRQDLDALQSLADHCGGALNRIQAEEAKAKLEDQLRRAQKMEALGTLAGGIAHDFNNILTAIVGNVALAEMALPPDHPARGFIGEVSKATQRATDLVRQILTFSRQKEQERKVIHLEPVVKEVRKLLRAALPSTIDIRLDVEPNLPSVLADASQIHQVLMNLATNAGHAMREHGGLLQIQLSRFQVTPELMHLVPDLREAPYIRLQVSDTGHGMEAKTVERIFDPFFTTKAPGEGTGLGLAVVHGIVKNHDGAITVYSQPGKGTTFHVYFPVTEEAATTPAASAPVPHGQGQRILFVDDEPALARVAEIVLRRLNYVVTACTKPAEALAQFRAHPENFDAVITDLTMPGTTGLELARQLLEIRPNVPILLVTGFSGTLTHEMVQQRGIRDLLLKPFTPDSLGNTLHQLFVVEEQKSSPKS